MSKFKTVYYTYKMRESDSYMLDSKSWINNYTNTASFGVDFIYNELWRELVLVSVEITAQGGSLW